LSIILRVKWTPFTAKFQIRKETKGTYCYEELTENGQPPKIGSLYIRKWALGNPVPQALTVTVQ